jgi:chemotaxis protein histidine kinase CheA
LQQARAEAEQKARTEVEALMAAERKAREAAEAKAAAEKLAYEQAERNAMQELALKVAAERKAREEAEQQAQAARQAREAAEQRAQAAAGNPDELRKAREQAEASARAAEEAVARANAIAAEAAQAKFVAESRVKAEQEARAAAEQRAKAEAVQRVMQEQQSQQRAESDVQARVAQELKAREQAERDADAKARAEAEARARKAAEERKLRGPEPVVANGAPPQVRRKKNWALRGAVATVVLVAAGIGLLHVMPLSGYVPGVQDLMSKRVGQPVTIGSMRYEMFPASQLTLQSVNIGKLQEIKIDALVVPIGPVGLLSGTRSFDTVEAHRVAVQQDALAALPAWTHAQSAEPALQVRRVKLRSVKVASARLELPQLDVDAGFGTRGELTKATINVQKARFDVTPKDKTWEVTLSASGWRPFIGPAIEFDEIEATAIVDSNQATVSEYKGRVGGGAISGQFKVRWNGAIQGSGDIKLENGRLNQLMPYFTRNFTSSGTLSLTATYALSSTDMRTLFDGARLEGTFSIAGGEFNNVDVARALQAAKAGGLRGGKTRFENLTGAVQVNGNQVSYRQLQLTSGALSASGNVEINDGTLSGRINAEIGSKGVVVARGGLSPVGTLRDPVLRP